MKKRTNYFDSKSCTESNSPINGRGAYYGPLATFVQLEALGDTARLLDKVVIACYITAKVIKDESPGTPNHQDRLRWADKLRNTSGNALPLQVLKVIIASEESETEATILAFTDAEWLAKVNTAVDDFEL